MNPPATRTRGLPVPRASYARETSPARTVATVIAVTAIGVTTFRVSLFFGQSGFTAQLHLAAVKADALHHDVVAFAKHVLNPVHATMGQLRDMHKTVGVGHNPNEGAKVHNLDHATKVGLSDLRLGETPLDDFDEVELELREGVEGDLPVSLYPRQVIEDAIGVELVRQNQQGSTAWPAEDAAGVL